MEESAPLQAKVEQAAQALKAMREDALKVNSVWMDSCLFGCLDLCLDVWMNVWINGYWTIVWIALAYIPTTSPFTTHAYLGPATIAIALQNLSA
jgi:hypothetical protein